MTINTRRFVVTMLAVLAVSCGLAWLSRAQTPTTGSGTITVNDYHLRLRKPKPKPTPIDQHYQVEYGLIGSLQDTLRRLNAEGHVVSSEQWGISSDGERFW